MNAIKNTKNKEKRHKIFVIIGMIYNYIFGVGKVIFGILILNLLYSLSGINTLLIGVSKNIYIKNLDQKGRIAPTIISSFIMLIGLLYSLYSIRFFFLEDKINNYPTTFAIAIAAFSFLELILAIKHLFNKKIRVNPLFLAFRSLAFSIALFAIVNTQDALLMATNNPNNMANGILGIIIGIITILLGLNSLIKSVKFYQKNTQNN